MMEKLKIKDYLDVNKSLTHKPKLYDLGMKELKGAWRHFGLQGRSPKSFEEIADGLSTFIKENCGYSI